MVVNNDDGGAAHKAAGRARVREMLITPLAALRRPNGVTVSAYDALADQLAYMNADALRGLVEFILLTVAIPGPPRTAIAPRCPAPDLIKVWAYGLQPPPPKESDYLNSIMRSALGHDARNGGWHVELYRHARRVGPPPVYAKFKLLEAADENRRTLARVRERIAAGVPMVDDRRWLDAWQADAQLADALIDEGEARRTAKAQHAGAA